MTPVPIRLAAARRRYGWRALGLSVPAMALIAAALVVQTPPSLRHGSVALALILVAMCVGVGALSLLWTWIIIWPTEGRRFSGAERLSTRTPPLSAARRESLRPLAVLVAGGLLVGILLWGLLNTVGLVGAPMLWIVAGTINVEVARRVRRIERAEHVVYYETSVTFPFSGGQRLFVQPRPAVGDQPSAISDQPSAISDQPSARSGQGATVRKRQLPPSSRKRAASSRPRR